MVDKQKMISGVLQVLMGFSVMLFFIGIIMNYDGYEILRNQQAYKPGLLKFDSLFSSSGDQYGSGSTGFWGHVDSVRIGIRFKSNNSLVVKDFLENVYQGKDAFFLVWYRPDGKLTLERYPHEDHFPTWRIWETAITLFLLLNFPFIVMCIIYWRLKRKYKKLESLKL